MSIREIKRQIARLKSSLTYSKDSGACKLAKKYDPGFDGDTYDALSVIDKGIRKQAEKHRNKNQ